LEGQVGKPVAEKVPFTLKARTIRDVPGSNREQMFAPDARKTLPLISGVPVWENDGAVVPVSD
jgi:hypothetical protein